MSPIFKTKSSLTFNNSTQDRYSEDTTIFIRIHCICTQSQQKIRAY